MKIPSASDIKTSPESRIKEIKNIANRNKKITRSIWF